MDASARFPERIVCLTEETTETLGSWCGKKFRPDAVRARPGWEAIPAVAEGDMYEIKSSIILQPGPAALTDGVEAIHDIISRWQRRHG